MHKLLKAKQDLIEIQKKRIEYLTNRTNSPSPSMANRKLNSHQAQSNGTVSTLGTNYSLKSFDQHSIQPKLRQTNKQSNFVEQIIHKETNKEPAKGFNANPSSFFPQSSKTFNFNDLLSSQIAASPSSSSSSMTQFCNYLAVNSLGAASDPNTNNKTSLNVTGRVFKLNEDPIKSNPNGLGHSGISRRITSTNNVTNYVDASSSTSSSSTALSTSSSLNHLNANQNNNFLRTSEL